MKIPPKKPHFFKPILPGFKEKLKIPKGFLKYLKGHSHIERAILKRTGKKWLVKLNGRRLEDGWEKFAGELSLQLGDLVIFRHEGDMEFEVSIFDSSECEREDGAEENNRTPEETSNKFEFKDATGKPKPKITSQCKAFSDLEAAKDMLLGRPHFISTVKPYWMSMSMIHVPKLFARESELSGRKCGIMIRDEERSWPFRLFYRGRHTFIGGEWRKFCAVNLLKEGDRILFEIFSNGEKPVLKIYDLRGDASLRPEGKKIYLDTEIVSTQGKLNASIKSSIKAASHAKAAAHKSDGHSNFVCTIKPYSLTYGFLMERHLYGNSLLLLMNSSEEVSGHLKAVAGRRVKTPDVAALKLQVPASTSADANPHFISIIKSYSITNSALYLPTAFAKSTGLMSGGCEIILIDEKHRSWSMWLGRMDCHFGIRRGWDKFLKANGLQVGDPSLQV
ncbi:putative B3 domain-containing protein REM15 [Capsicum annuum]